MVESGKGSVVDHRVHLKSLDGMRGLAIVLVFLFHFYPRGGRDPIGVVASLGWMGVDLFFVLSGFLITGVLYDTVSQRHYFRNFYMRRALRLFPVYFLMVGLVLGLGHWLQVRYGWWDVPYFLYGSNIVGDLRLAPSMGPYVELGHLWSLALEEQFYLLWAPIVFFLKTKRRILIACAAGSLLAFGLRWIVGTRYEDYTSYIELPTRLDGLLSGAALALVARSDTASAWLTERRLNVCVAAGAAVLMACVGVSHTTHWSSAPMIHFGYLAASVMFVGVIALAIKPRSWADRLGSVSWLRVFGRYNYGFYL